MYPDARDEVVQLYLDDIIPNRFQPREVFDEQALKELAVSIREHGVIQPIIVRPVANGKYEIIAGERRYKASAMAGLTKIPAIVRDLDDKESSKVALLENLQRKNLNPIEEARTYQKILEIDQMTQEDLAKTMGKSQSSVANKLRLLSLPDEIQQALLQEQISERHARTMLNIPDLDSQKAILKEVIDNKMSVRALEEEIKNKFPKEEKEENNEEKTDDISTTNAFVNTKPLIPTAEIEDEVSNYGKVTIAPPEGEEMPQTGKFLNFDQKEENSSNTLVPAIEPENKDIPKPQDGAALDNLLNINFSPVEETPAEPTENIIDTDNSLDESSDYFQSPDLPSIDLPESVVNPLDNMSTQNKMTIEEAKSKIKNAVDEIKANGINLTMDEMNFEKSYQVIIKIDKTQE